MRLPMKTGINLSADLDHRLGRSNRVNYWGAKFANDLPGAPPGDYVVFGFASVFQEHDNIIETVTAKKDDNGVWRVAGYFIR